MAHANPTPQEWLNQITCEVALSKNLAQSEIFRTRSLKRLIRYRDKHLVLQKRATENFLREMNSRQGGKVKVESTAFKAQVAEFQVESPPPLSNQTRQALNIVYDPLTYAKLENGDRSATKHRLLSHARDAVNADPYFRWLKKYAGEFRQQQPSGSQFITDPGLAPETPNDDFDPTRLLFSSLEVGGSSFLAPDLSIVRVYRNLDPLISEGQRMVADIILDLYALQMITEREIMPVFEERSHSMGSQEAWNLAPDLPTAQKNRRRLLDLIRATYSPHMSRSAFEKAQILWKNDPQLGNAVRSLIPENLGNKQPDPKNVESLNRLKTELKLSPDLSAERVLHICRAAARSEISYERFLLNAFVAGQDDFWPIVGVLTTLDTIIRTAENLGSAEAFSYDLLEIRQETGRYSY